MPIDSPRDTVERPRCLRCLRPEPMCLCGGLPMVPTRTRIVVLQHPHERTHPFGTARLVRLCMPNAEVHVPIAGYTGTLACPLELPDDAAVLYPRSDAPLLDDLPPGQHPSTLVVIDGTWAHAKRLYRENDWLHARPHVRLQPTTPSNYRIRREPRPDYVSTLEAIVAALRVLEPENEDLDALLAAFDGMIDRQLAHTSSTPRAPRRRRERQRERRTLSPLLAHPRLTIVYAETSMPHGAAPGLRQLVHWVAHRIDGDGGDGTTFEACFAPPAGLPTTAHLAHMGLDATSLTNGESVAAAAERFRAFLGDAPVAAWTASSLQWGAPLLPAGTQQVVLKTDWCNLTHRRAGFLDELVEEMVLERPLVNCRGRARERLANAVAIARWLRDRLGR